MLKEELLSDLLFPEDQGNCKLQKGVITWILKGKWNALVVFNQLSNMYCIHWVFSLVSSSKADPNFCKCH